MNNFWSWLLSDHKSLVVMVCLHVLCICFMVAMFTFPALNIYTLKIIAALVVVVVLGRLWYTIVEAYNEERSE